LNDNILELNNISKAFPGVQALDDVTIKVKKGSVHALMGENGAGKSTLMKCLFGIYKMDFGEILFNGERVNIDSPHTAINLGISMIHQELQPILDRSVAENIFVGRFPLKRVGPVSIIDHKKMNNDTKEVLDDLQLGFSPDVKLSDLSVSQMQSVEIAKAVSTNAKVVIMDEPTSSLTSNEVENLFRIIRELQKDGVAIIYISHKMEEILEISDEVSIMRDGKHVGTWNAEELTTDFIISKMVGRELTNRFPVRQNVPGEAVFKLEDFSSINPKSFQNINFELRKGEILGIGGLVGAQRTELMEAVFGIRQTSSGTIYFKGEEIKIKRPKDAIDRGIALLTEDRRATGIFGILPVADNVAVASLKQYVDYRIILNNKKIEHLVEENVDKLNIKTPSSQTLIQSLSGGNQQKVIFSRWLANDPEVLILDEPTRGIDVGAKYEIYTIIESLAREGKSIIMITSEMPELLGMSDRIVVMCEGRISGILEGKEATQEKVMELCTKFM
jgi:ABC-type sugar transport system, ATPase component